MSNIQLSKLPVLEIKVSEKEKKSDLMFGRFVKGEPNTIMLKTDISEMELPVDEVQWRILYIHEASTTYDPKDEVYNVVGDEEGDETFFCCTLLNHKGQYFIAHFMMRKSIAEVAKKYIRLLDKVKESISASPAHQEFVGYEYLLLPIVVSTVGKKSKGGYQYTKVQSIKDVKVDGNELERAVEFINQNKETIAVCINYIKGTIESDDEGE